MRFRQFVLKFSGYVLLIYILILCLRLRKKKTSQLVIKADVIALLLLFKP